MLKQSFERFYESEIISRENTFDDEIKISDYREDYVIENATKAIDIFNEVLDDENLQFYYIN
jgi:hypothetical protein